MYTTSAYSVSFEKQKIRREMEELKDSQDPEPNPSIEYLFVLSGAGSYLKKITPIQFNDKDDDYNRMQLAIQTAKKIASMNVNVSLDELNFEQMRRYGPKIIYNGRDEQNIELRRVLENSIRDKSDDESSNEEFIDYPPENFIILDISKDEINTKGQFISIKQDLPLENLSVGIITHAYHYPRVARMLGKEAPLYPFRENVKKYAFLVDRQFSSPGIIERINSEVEKIPIYVTKGDLSANPAPDITYLRGVIA